MRELTRRKLVACFGSAVGSVFSVRCLSQVSFPLALLSGKTRVLPPDHGPIGKAKGVKPGRVVWAFDPKATPWEGPQNGHWWEPENTSYERVEVMLCEALKQLTGESSEKAAWRSIFASFKSCEGKGGSTYKPGEKIAIKVNFVGMIFHEGCVDPKKYRIYPRHVNYMNTSPQLICALLKSLIESTGARQEDITIFDTLAYIAGEYFQPVHRKFPRVRWVGYGGAFGRIKARQSQTELHWSCPEESRPDLLPLCVAEANYLINMANLKAHTGAGVTLCAKNHFGSLVRWPVQRGYYNLHRNTFAKKQNIYRPLVDLMAHSHLGGKTILYLLDGLYSGKHPIDRVPRRWSSKPFSGHWTSSIFLSQDPVAIDSVGFDFLKAEYEDYPRRVGVDDYLHEAALIGDPPSGTSYGPDSPRTSRSSRKGPGAESLGTHEHWKDSEEKNYSRNLGEDKGIELVKCFF